MTHWMPARKLKGMFMESTQQVEDTVMVLNKMEQDVIPRVENPKDRRQLEELCRQMRNAMGSGDRKKIEEAAATLRDQLFAYVYLW